jgi:curved DNA-binding protein CbpA
MINKNYFEILQLEEKFNLNQSHINRQYFALQKIYYPDRSSGSVLKALDLNEAYLHLADPLSRAQHIFELSGMDICTKVLNLKAFQKIIDSQNTLETALNEMEDAFELGDLELAYQAWCKCQYLKRMGKMKF